MQRNYIVLNVFYNRTFGTSLRNDIGINAINDVLDLIRRGLKYKAIMMLCKKTNRVMTSRMHCMYNKMEKYLA